MIEILHGIKETVVYKNQTGFSLRWNTDTECFPPHWHMAYEIIMPVDNTYQVTVDKTSYLLQPGEVLLVKAGEIHSLTPPESGKRIFFLCDQQNLYTVHGLDAALLTLPPALYFSRESESQREIYALLMRIAALCDRHEPFSEAAVYAHLILLFVQFCSANSREAKNSGANITHREYAEKLYSVCDYIQSHYTGKITLETAAEHAGFSKFHFARLFKDFTRLTFTDYLIKTRVQQAKYLLTDSKLSILDIALQSGFSSLSSFNRSFRLLNNCSPSSFRKKLM